MLNLHIYMQVCMYTFVEKNFVLLLFQANIAFTHITSVFAAFKVPKDLGKQLIKEEE